MHSYDDKCSNYRLHRRFGKNQDGGVAMIFALAFIPVLGLSGAAVDYASATQTRARMSQAADAAVLATANQTGLTNEARTLYAKRYFEANLAGLPVSELAVRLKDVGPALRIEAEANMKTNFMGLLGIDKMQLSVAAEVMRGGDNVELALVMDTTYSMVNDLAGAKVSAKDFINMLQPNTGNGGLKISIVPYIASVNPGRSNLGMSSMDVFAESSRHARYFEGAMVGRGNCIHTGGDGGGTGKDPGGGRQGILASGPPAQARGHRQGVVRCVAGGGAGRDAGRAPAAAGLDVHNTRRQGRFAWREVPRAERLHPPGRLRDHQPQEDQRLRSVRQDTQCAMGGLRRGTTGAIRRDG
jgi:Flp pilus assembly protein TadG